VLEREPELTSPCLLFGLGRGQTGKSSFARWAIDRAGQAGREVVPADGDRSNATLSSYYPAASHPSSAHDADVRSWITGLVERIATERTASVVLDLGGGDRTMEDYAREFPLVDFCQEHAIRLVVAYFVAPNADSLAPILTIEESGVFRGASTILVLNEGLVPLGMASDAAFAPVREHAGFRKVLDHARLVVMPKLACMTELERRRVSFFCPEPGKLGPMNAFLVNHWLKRMEEAFQPVRQWLP
jgi:hypothetical protein